MKKAIITLMLALFASLVLSAQPGYVPSEEILKARSEFQDEKFDATGLNANLTPAHSGDSDTHLTFRLYGISIKKVLFIIITLY